MRILITIAITISSLFYLYFLLTVILVNHYRQPVKTYVKRERPYQLFIVIPVLNEELIIGRTIERLSAELAKLPKSIHAQIIAVDDDSKDQSLRKLAESQSPYLQILHRAGNRRLGKGAVLNTAVDYVKTTLAANTDPKTSIIGVLDADAFMTAHDLTQVVAHFEAEPKMAMLQTGVLINNQQNWLTKMQNFEFMGINNATQQLRNQLGAGIASGNGQFVRLQLAQQNPWGNSLLEDLEFTLRTWLLGGRTVFDHHLVVEQEAVTQLHPFFRQRVRWCQGAVQCMHYLPALWRSKQLNYFQKIDTSFWILMPITGCIIPITSVITLIILVSRSLTNWHVGWHHLAIITIVAITLLVCLLLANILQRNYASIQRKVPLLSAFWQGLSFQAYLLIVGMTPYVAIYRQLHGRTDWTKTHHGTGGTPVAVRSRLKRSF
ncbi:glycosyltransferase family 2 protein [Lactiplantibacillus modestisalitolerans]|uniref:Glycosyltransferase family 2 protein n=1 Tax=Lactiplantibacillus modestisalitolerans TaxID=1457219 RepID=A0ABV5WWB5_9LACO|nr:glycosyltransferase family 2 protein [Lactiplantibacillus modestisalitolerans]